ncbi:MAG: hypothetical protein ACTJH9_13755 [Pseudoalteromonas sp.]|uniref:hypothetical protein n=1 Tax=unclassified Pseudoalteromonas TaxID=194690 RepID=UPI003F9A053D
MSRYFFSILFLFFISNKVYAAMEFPDEATVVLVSDSMLVDGMQIKAWEFKSESSVSQNIKFFTESWEPQSQYFSQDKLEEWEVLNALIDDQVYTAKLRSTPGKSTFGYMAISKEPDSKLSKLNKTLQNFPMPSGTDVIRDIKASDGPKTSNTMILKNNLSVKRNLSFYHDYFTQYNWAIDKAAYTKGLNNGVFIARNGPNNINITFSRNKGATLITAVREDVR